MLRNKQLLLVLSVLLVGASCEQKPKLIEMAELYPWCIVAYDSLERTPAERIDMLQELGFEKYAYDWRDRHLDDTKEELSLAVEKDIEVISVWLWLNAKRDSIDKISLGNERLFSILEDLRLETTFWVSMSPNFFKEQADETSLKEAIAFIQFIAEKAEEINCKVALYNHTGWFANPNNQIKIIDALPQHELSIVYNFHHGHKDVERFPALVEDMLPYLSAVNLNGMRDGHKVLTIGKGEYEKQMLQTLLDAGYTSPFGILGHVEGADVRTILEENLAGLQKMPSLR
ncbi:sugar phosphate isomerase/epimerase family protein [Carboxylicivirga sp. RSCT41]|uniref:sugar phosphate isomerase/epimerase family protein n=1 Tax=Carboxylicivirga agarovorans TaxID=3417570 RepID=UPI003D35296D